MLSDLRFMDYMEWYTTPQDEGLDAYVYPDGRGYHLKDGAPEEARKAYESLYGPDEMVDENGRRLRASGMSAYY